MKHLRAALHAAVDLVLDAIEKDRAPHEGQAPLEVPVRASRRGAGLRAYTPVPVDEVSQRRADAVLRRKGLL